MRKKIWRMSEDRFDTEKPQIEYSIEKISEDIMLGESTERTFSFRCKNGVPLRGIVYSSNPYVTIVNPQFEGNEAHIRYTANLESPRAGEVLRGKFTVIANCYEGELSYTLRFLERDLTFDETPIKTLSDFAALCREHSGRALRLFYSDVFQNFMNRQDEGLRRLYRGYAYGQQSPQNIEEFLIAAGEKKRCHLSVDEAERRYFELTENQKDTIEITRDTWGAVALRFSSDADFVTVEKDSISQDFFLGSSVTVHYYVHINRMHAGLNRATISIDTDAEHFEIVVTASLSKENDERYLPAHHFHKLKQEFTNVYRDFRLHGMKSAEFAEKSLDLIDKWQAFSDDKKVAGGPLDVPKKDAWLMLMKAQALIVDRREEEALWIIQDLKQDIAEKDGAEWAYLLYLCTLLEPEEENINRLTAEIEVIFHKNPNDVRIFWFLLFLREEYIGDNGRKLHAIEQWIMEGVSSPYLYIEAFYLINREPFLLRSFSEFNTRLLLWTVNRKCFSRDLALQVAHLLEGEKTFRRDVYRIATAAFRMFPEEDELFMQILSLLLKTQQTGEEFYTWYEMAVQKEVRLTGLFEAYLMSLPDDFSGQLPELLTMYFRYQSNLSYQGKAYVYANVVQYRKDAPNVYEQYLRSIESFALEQMRLGRIDDNLAVLYQVILNIGLINADIANSMAELLFTHEIDTTLSNARKVLIFEDFREKPYEAAVFSGKAYAPILTKEMTIFLEDETGRLYADPTLYETTQLIDYDDFYEQLRSQATEQKKVPYIIHDFDDRKTDGLFRKQDLSYVETFLDSAVIARSYKAGLYPKLLTFLSHHNREDMLDKHLLFREPYDLLNHDLLTYMLEISISNGLYDKAYELLHRFNGTDVDLRKLRQLFTHILTYEENAIKSDDFLISFTAELMTKDVFAEEMISYLNRFYVGPTDEMRRLCQLTETYRLKAESLYERTLVQMLYTEQVGGDSGNIFLAYLDHNPNKMVIEAYLTYFSRQYILEEGKQSDVPEEVFAELLHYFNMDIKLNESCRIALMKRLCVGRQLDEKEHEALDTLVNDFVMRNVYFGFYKEMDRRLLVKYHLYDKTFLSYRTERGKKLFVRFSDENAGRVGGNGAGGENGGSRSDDASDSRLAMIEMYEGIYVCQFVLFFGDRLDYEIFEIENHGAGADREETHTLKTGTLSSSELSDERENSRFARLNRMQSLIVYGEEEKLLSDMEDYERTLSAAEKLFTVV